MNRLYRTIVGILTSTAIISIYAADYVPMIREGRVWEYTGSCGVSSDPCHAYHYMKFDGTADVNGTEYHRFVQFKTLTVGDNDGKIRDRRYGDIFVYYLREDEGKVYFLYDSGNGAIVCQDLEAPDGFKADGELKEFKVYDFTLTDGETWNYPHYLEWRVPGGPDETEMQTVRYEAPRAIEGETCRVMSFRDLSVMGSEDLLKFIEGIGTTVNGCLVNPSLGNISGVVNNSMSAGVQSCLNRVFDAEGNVVYAQENASEPPVNDGYIPMLVEGKVWVWKGRALDEEVPVYYTVTGTEEIDGKSCFRVDQTSDIPELSGGSWLLCEEGGKVSVRYVDPDDNVSWLPLYDFSMTTGEEHQISIIDERGLYDPQRDNRWKVTGEENVLVRGVTRRMMSLSTTESHHKTVWVEGVGAPYLDGQLTWFWFPEPDNGIYLIGFKECIEDGEVIFSFADFGDPASVRGAGDDSSVGLNEDTIYDVMGRRVDTTVPGSVYIRGGKKFVAR